MTSILFKPFASPLPVSSIVFFSVTSILSIISPILFPSTINLKKYSVAATANPSRVQGIPTPASVSQDDGSVLAISLLVISVIVIALASGAAWVRSPRFCGRLKREGPHPPPPPPPPPPQDLNEADADANADDDGAADRNQGGGDDDPQQDPGADGDNGRDNGDLATAAAPVPEDPSPPPGGVDEDEDDDDDYMSDGGLSWLVLFVFGTLIIDNLRGKVVYVLVEGFVRVG